MHRIYVLDPAPISRHGLRLTIEEEYDMEVVGESGSFESFLADLDGLSVDGLVTELALADTSGLTVITELRRRGHQFGILVFSDRDEVLYAGEAFRVGAEGYLMKTAPSAEVVSAVRQVLGRGVYVSEAMSRHFLHLMARGYGDRPEQSIRERLSPREVEVFRLLGRGESSSDIARELDLSEHTVQSYRARIKQKLGIETREELIRKAVLFGEE